MDNGPIFPYLTKVGAEGRRRQSPAGCWLPVQVFEVLRDGENVLSSGTSTTSYGREVVDVRLPRKALNTINFSQPVPETDTGREVEYTKGREITLSKELGKMAP